MFLPKLAVWGMREQKAGSVASLMLQQVIWAGGGGAFLFPRPSSPMPHGHKVAAAPLASLALLR